MPRLTVLSGIGFFLAVALCADGFVVGHGGGGRDCVY